MILISETIGRFVTDSTSRIQTLCPALPTLCRNRRHRVYSLHFLPLTDRVTAIWTESPLK